MLFMLSVYMLAVYMFSAYMLSVSCACAQTRALKTETGLSQSFLILCFCFYPSLAISRSLCLSLSPFLSSPLSVPLPPSRPSPPHEPRLLSHNTPINAGLCTDGQKVDRRGS